MVAGVELTYNTSATALQMAQEIFGAGVTITQAQYFGDPRASAIYSNGDALSPFATPGDRGVILSTGQAQAFTTQNATQSNTSGGTTTANDGPSNVFGAGTFDTSYLDIRFIPTGNILTIQFVFASEEYPEYVNSSFNDLVIIEVNGTRIPLSVATDSGSVSSINPNTNGSLYNDNTADQFNTEMDGFTATLSLNMVVNAGEVNRIRIGIADVGDDQWDSNLLIAADSLQTAFVANDDSRTMFINQEKTLDILANDSAPLGSTLTLTHINGLPVVAGQQITLPTGQVITVNLNGTISVLTDADIGTVSFSYTAQTSTGISDSAFVTIQTIPCFTRGTRLDTPYGPRRIEDLRIGDLVLTRDDGPRPIRWIGRRQVAATGRFAPVRIAAGVMGATEDVLVSPLHRVLVAGPTAELLFGAREVLVASRDLVDGHRIRIEEGERVVYFHLLFDRHQVVTTSGLESESFLVGPQTRHCFDQGAVDEICALFPELDRATGGGYGPSARPSLRPFEARLVMA
jgi:hypothetical protein